MLYSSMPEKKCELIKVRTIFYADFISLLFRVMLLWKKKIMIMVIKTRFSMSLSSFFENASMKFPSYQHMAK